EICWIRLMTAPIFWAAFERPTNSSFVACTLLTALCTILVGCSIFRPISVAEPSIWRVAIAAFSTLADAPCDACAIPFARNDVCSDDPDNLAAVDFMAFVQSLTVL